MCISMSTSLHAVYNRVKCNKNPSKPTVIHAMLCWDHKGCEVSWGWLGSTHSHLKFGSTKDSSISVLQLAFV